jgi:pyruvate/2-oxoglutarate/acetoin dehydrogenase E1 component
MNIPGLKIVAPSTPYDAKGCLIEGIRDNNPTMYVEHRLLFYQRGHVPKDGYTVPFGRARVFTSGRDITLVGISQMAIECLRAQKYLEEVGIKAEVIDPVSLSPLDTGTIEQSVLKTGRLIVVDNAWMTCGAGAEIITQLTERGVEMTPHRMGFAFVPCPTTPTFEEMFYPNAKRIASKAHEMVYPGKEWNPKTEIEIEEVEFKGPF